MRRAMTLLETITALSLLSMLAAASFGWISSSQRTLSETSASTRWARSATATLTQFADDIRSFDAASNKAIHIEPAQSPDSSSATMPIESVAMRSRSPGEGACWIEFQFEKRVGQISRITNGDDRLLLGSVERLEIELLGSPVDPDGPRVALIARLVSANGDSAERVVPLGGREIAP